MCEGKDGQEDNYRLDYLIADYKIRLVDDEGTDWYLISEPSVRHSNLSKNVTVTAGHIAQLLKTKNLALEFSDDEGNNIGTASALLDCILEGTGWTAGTVYRFVEEDDPNTEKVRTLNASVKTGAFKLISKMCDLFDAKPVYHGDTKTVDIVPMNPFSEPENGGLPAIEDDRIVAELNYSRNVKSVTRTLNTENIVTRLYAYGSYGDDTTGYCGIDEIAHYEYYFGNNTENVVAAGTECAFTYLDKNNLQKTIYFVAGNELPIGAYDLVYSDRDPASMMYVWHSWTETVNNEEVVHEAAYRVYDKPVTVNPVVLTEDPNRLGPNPVISYNSSLMDFTYYNKIGLLSDDALLTIAKYQRHSPALLEAAQSAAAAYAEKNGELSEIIGSVDFCKLAVASCDSTGSGYAKLTLDTTVHGDGVIYRTDYDKRKIDQFKWRIAEE